MSFHQNLAIFRVYVNLGGVHTHIYINIYIYITYAYIYIHIHMQFHCAICIHDRSIYDLPMNQGCAILYMPRGWMHGGLLLASIAVPLIGFASIWCSLRLLKVGRRVLISQSDIQHYEMQLQELQAFRWFLAHARTMRCDCSRHFTSTNTVRRNPNKESFDKCELILLQVKQGK